MEPHGKYANVDAGNPEAFAQCDRCGFWFNRTDLVFQTQWAGTHLYQTGALVCTTGNRCFDIPQEQLRTIVLPADPLPVINARVPNFAYEEQTVRVTEYNQPTNPPWGAGPAMIRCLENGQTMRILEFNTSS